MGTPVLVPLPHFGPYRCALSLNQRKQPGRRSAFSSRLLLLEQVPPEPQPPLAIAHFVTFGVVDRIAPAQPSLNERQTRHLPATGDVPGAGFFRFHCSLLGAENVYVGGPSLGLSSTLRSLAAFFSSRHSPSAERAGPNFVFHASLFQNCEWSTVESHCLCFAGSFPLKAVFPFSRCSVISFVWPFQSGMFLSQSEYAPFEDARIS